MAPKIQKSKFKKNVVGASGSKIRKLELTKYTSEEINNMTNSFSDEIDKGAYSKVYRGQLNNEDIAVKVYANGSHKNREQAENELQALKDFGCYPRIVQVRGICVDGPRCLVMKFVPNDLKTLMNACELKWPEALKILLQLASAIKSIIKEDYVVADIRPANVLIDEDYNVHLCDFGSAKKGGRDLPTGNNHYAPKEVVMLGRGTEKTDIFSYGVILLQMITRCNNFQETRSMFKTSMKAQEEIYWKSQISKKDKKAKNSSRNTTGQISPHLAVYARVGMKKEPHIVHKALISSGCGQEDAKTISLLGIQCTNEDADARPTIEEIISVLEKLN